MYTPIEPRLCDSLVKRVHLRIEQSRKSYSRLAEVNRQAQDVLPIRVPKLLAVVLRVALRKAMCDSLNAVRCDRASAFAARPNRTAPVM
jgi:hypothetical protein